MQLVDVRRLTGPNLLLAVPGTVLDVACEQPSQVLAALRGRVSDHLTALRARSDAWQQVTGSDAARTWHEDTGCSWALALPPDLLRAGLVLMEAVLEDVAAEVGAGTPVAPAAVDDVLAATEAHRDEPLLRLLAEAARRGVAAPWDDDLVTVGLGSGSRTWSRDRVPRPDEVPWPEVRDVPVALVTGTNGKSTTVRMLAAVLAADGRTTGHTSTDGVVVAGEVVDAGDWSGPGGGRMVARDQRVQAMVLECARGGMLRSGLPLGRADVAVVTNVAADHLGEYGIRTVDDLVQAKLVVARAVTDSGVLVCNAQDPRLPGVVDPGPRVWWFAVDPTEARLREGVAAGGRAWTVEDGVLGRRDGAGWTPCVPVAQVPATHGGAARHNVANALATAAAADALGAPMEAIATGLRGFGADPATNPGRAASYDLEGTTIVVDYGHNEHAARVLTEWMTALDGDRLLVLCSAAGDRSAEDLDAYVGALHEAGVDRWALADLPAYLRGRAPMEVPHVLADLLRRRGVADEALTFAAHPVQAAAQLLDEARSGDVVLLLVLQDRDEVADLLADRGAVAR